MYKSRFLDVNLDLSMKEAIFLERNDSWTQE